jgi:hypothetical protein
MYVDTEDTDWLCYKAALSLSWILHAFVKHVNSGWLPQQGIRNEETAWFEE